jgi:creatinine amidohydrolase
MAQIRRRDLLLAGLAVPAMPGIVKGGSTAGDDSSAKPKRFEDTVGFEVADLMSRSRLAILPLGSLEFHGPHNPLGSDSIIISGIAERVAARTSGLLFPTITFTQCPAYTAQFRGTLSLRTEVMTVYFADVMRNIARLGFRKILILNGHDGNVGPGRGAMAQVADENKDAALLFVSWWEFLPSEMMKTLGMFHQANGGHGHGGPLETSAVAAFRPELVHLDQARDLPEPPDLSGGPPYVLQKSTAAGWPGYSGKISEASAEKGNKIVRISEDAIVKLVENWLQHDEVPGSW